MQFTNSAIKKPYHQPQLVVYGNINELTQAAVDRGGVYDNVSGTPIPNKSGKL